jgi:hypothetical protein
MSQTVKIPKGLIRSSNLNGVTLNGQKKSLCIPIHISPKISDLLTHEKLEQAILLSRGSVLVTSTFVYTTYTHRE